MYRRRVARYWISGAALASVLGAGLPLAAMESANRGVRETQYSRDHTVELADLEKLSFPDVTLQLSPDGSTLAFALSDDNLSLINTHDLAPPTNLGGGFLPMWSPDGSRVAFYSRRSGSLQLWVYDVAERSSQQATFIVGGIDPDPTTRIVGWVHDAFRYSWAPDSTHIAFASRVPERTRSAVMAKPVPKSGIALAEQPLLLDKNSPVDWALSGIFQHSFETAGLAESKDGHSYTAKSNALPGPTLVSQLFVVNIDNGSVVQITKGFKGNFHPCWSPSGEDILFISQDEAGPAFDAKATNVYSIDWRTRIRTAITHGPGIRSRPSWSADGRAIAFLRSEGKWDYSSIWAGLPSIGRFAEITTGLDRHISDFVWGPNSALFFSYRDGISTPLAAFSLENSTITVVSKDASEEYPVETGSFTSTRFGDVAWASQDPRNLLTIRFRRRNSAGKSRILLKLFPESHNWALGSVQIIRWQNSHGDAMEGVLLLPPAYRPGQTYPMIVDVYPTRTGADWTRPMFGNQAWASMGYAVFRPNPRGPHVWMNPWKSPESVLVAKGRHGWEVALDDVMTGVDKVIGMGVADSKRMCLYGFSNGGGVVNNLITRTDRFACAVSVAGALSDWIRPALLNPDSDWLTTVAGVSIRDDPTTYVDLSAVMHLNSVKTPVLLADGDDDGDFLLDTIEMYNGLRRIGAEVTLLRYPGQAHGFSGPALRDFWTREMRFFARYLDPKRQ
jgi:dipeptidyl aminopeptidase/acylaminoacyl peptidase